MVIKYKFKLYLIVYTYNLTKTFLHLSYSLSIKNYINELGKMLIRFSMQ